MGGAREAILAYHEQTKHSQASLQREPHTLDWANMPRPFKVYVDLDPIPLPHDLASSSWPALAAIADRGRVAGPAPLDRRALARLLYFSAGVLRRRAYPGGEVFYRAAACTGALYHIDLYVVCAGLADLDAGVYHFGPHDFALRRLRAGDHRATLVAAAAGEPSVGDAPVVLVYTSTFWRNAWKYRARAYRHCFWDAGTILANLLAVASATGQPARVVQAVVDAEVNRLLDLDGEREVALGLVALGSGAPVPPSAPPSASLGLATLPLSAREVSYPQIVAAHAATSLASAGDVAAARATVRRVRRGGRRCRARGARPWRGARAGRGRHHATRLDAALSTRPDRAAGARDHPPRRQRGVLHRLRGDDAGIRHRPRRRRARAGHVRARRRAPCPRPAARRAIPRRGRLRSGSGRSCRRTPRRTCTGSSTSTPCWHARARAATAPRSSPPRSPADARISPRTRSASAPPASPSSTTT